MVHCFKARSADDVWLQAAGAFTCTENVAIQNSRAGKTVEILHAALVVESPINRWVVSRVPALNPAFSVVEAVWVLNGMSDAAFLNSWNRRLPNFAGRCLNYHGAYGNRLRHTYGFDQLTRAFKALRSNEESRQVVLQIWDPKQDFPNEDGSPAAEDIPCNIASMLKIRNDRLEWMQVVRSNDLLLGVPHDIALFTLLQEVMAGWLGIGIGSYNQISDSLHVYETDFNHIKCATKVPHAENEDSVALPKEQSDMVWSQFAERIESLTDQGITRQRILDTLQWDIPSGYLNLMRVVCAEAARRRKWVDTALEVISGISNPVLTQLCERWFKRVGRTSPTEISRTKSSTANSPSSYL